MKKKIKPQCGLLIENGKGEILLQLRDNNPALPYPNCWGTFGGQIEDGETPEQAIIREIKEELDYNLKDPELYGIYPFDGYNIYMFRKCDSTIKLEDLLVREGQRAEFFSNKNVSEIVFAFNCKEIVADYFRRFP